MPLSGVRASEDSSCLRPLGHRDRLWNTLLTVFVHNDYLFLSVPKAITVVRYRIHPAQYVTASRVVCPLSISSSTKCQSTPWYVIAFNPPVGEERHGNFTRAVSSINVADCLCGSKTIVEWQRIVILLLIIQETRFLSVAPQLNIATCIFIILYPITTQFWLCASSGVGFHILKIHKS
jgi:hypothetical protein